MFGSSSTTSTRGPLPLFTGFMLIMKSESLLGELWGLASSRLGPARDAHDRAVVAHEPGGHAMRLQPRRRVLAHDDRRGGRDVGVDAAGGGDRRSAPARLGGQAGGGVDDVVQDYVASHPTADDCPGCGETA